MSFTPLAALGTLVFTFVNFLTYVAAGLRKKGWNGALTQIIAWAAGIAGIFIAAKTQFANQITFGSGSQKLSLSAMAWPTKLFLGLIATSILSTVNEVKKAIDNKDDATKEPLLTKPGEGS